MKEFDNTNPKQMTLAEIRKEAYQQGIDDLSDAIVQKFTEYDKKGYNNHTNAGIKTKVHEIAEQIKEQNNGLE